MAGLHQSDHGDRFKHQKDASHSARTEPSIDEQLAGIGINLARHGVATVNLLEGRALDEEHSDEVAVGTVGGVIVDEFVKYSSEVFLDEPINLGADTTSSLALLLYSELGSGEL